MFKQIKGFKKYIIYDNGDVENIITHHKLKGSIGVHGYKYYRLSNEAKRKVMKYAHRLVAEAFIDNPNNLPIVNHLDGNKLNNNLSNLEWTSYSENAIHAYSNNLIAPTRRREYYKEDLLNEQWLPIFDNPYSISSFGRVRNDRTKFLLKPSIVCGYYKVRLSVNGKVSDQMVHNLVYCTFNHLRSGVPSGYVVNHIDGDKLNNSLSNLELVTLSDNVKKSYYETKTNKSCKAVQQFDLNNNFIQSFPSAREAARQLNLDASTISKVCRGKNKTHGGFIFKYSK